MNVLIVNVPHCLNVNGQTKEFKDIGYGDLIFNLHQLGLFDFFVMVDVENDQYRVMKSRFSYNDNGVRKRINDIDDTLMKLEKLL